MNARDREGLHIVSPPRLNPSKPRPSIRNDFKRCVKPVADVIEHKLGHIFGSDPACWCCFCPSCHVINSHYDVLLTGSSP